MKEKRKKFTLYLTDKELELFGEAAKKSDLSTSELIRHIALSGLQNTEVLRYRKEDRNGQEKKHGMKIELSDQDYITLKIISAQAGLTMSDYLRSCIRLKKLKLVNVDIKHHDIDEHTMLIAELTKKVGSVCNTISKSKTAYPQEVAKILQLLTDINDNSKWLLDIVYKDRKKLFLLAQKELLKNLRDSL